jgi:hypothetical protein
MEPLAFLMLLAAFVAGLSLGVLFGLSLTPASEVQATGRRCNTLFSQLDVIKAGGAPCPVCQARDASCGEMV